jgi:hypothetical protein
MRRTLPALPAHSFAVSGKVENAHRFAEQEVSLLPVQPFMSDSEACSNGLAGLQTRCTPS